MARNQKTKTSSNQETKTSATTLRLDDEWMMYLNIRAMSKGSSMSAFVQALLANDLSSLSRAESEPLREPLQHGRISGERKSVSGGSATRDPDPV